jgi:hypothetical protein
VKVLTEPGDYPDVARPTINVHPPAQTRPCGFIWPTQEDEPDETKKKAKRKKQKP